MPKCKVYINLVLSSWNKTVDRAGREEGGSDTRRNHRNWVKYDISSPLPKLDPPPKVTVAPAHWVRAMLGQPPPMLLLPLPEKKLSAEPVGAGAR